MSARDAMALRSMHSRSALAALTVSLAARATQACPSCAANGVDTSRTLVSVGVFLLLPFLLVGLVVAFVRTLPKTPGATAAREAKR